MSFIIAFVGTVMADWSGGIAISMGSRSALLALVYIAVLVTRVFWLAYNKFAGEVFTATGSSLKYFGVSLLFLMMLSIISGVDAFANPTIVCVDGDGYFMSSRDFCNLSNKSYGKKNHHTSDLFSHEKHRHREEKQETTNKKHKALEALYKELHQPDLELFENSFNWVSLERNGSWPFPAELPNSTLLVEGAKNITDLSDLGNSHESMYRHKDESHKREFSNRG